MNRQTEILFHEISRDIYKVSNVNINSVSRVSMSRTISLFSLYLEKFRKNSWKDGNTLKYEWEKRVFPSKLTRIPRLKILFFIWNSRI